MYIAGLKSPLSPPQWLEVLVVLGTAEYFPYVTAKMKQLAVISESKAGKVRPESIPPAFLGRIITPIHRLAIFVPPLIYVGAVALNGFQQPDWMAKFAFPDGTLDSTWKNGLRVLACIASFTLKGLTDSIFEHLGDQWHAIGVRK